MKTLIIIILLLPTLLFAQKDSTHQTFKIGNCRAGLIVGKNIYFDNYPILPSEITKGARVKLFGCGDSTKIIDFYLENGGPADTIHFMRTNSSYLSKDMVNTFSKIKPGDCLIFRDIHYLSKRDTLEVDGFILKVR